MLPVVTRIIYDPISVFIVKTDCWRKFLLLQICKITKVVVAIPVKRSFSLYFSIVGGRFYIPKKYSLHLKISD
jgi:hypothetical protein